MAATILGTCRFVACQERVQTPTWLYLTGSGRSPSGKVTTNYSRTSPKAASGSAIHHRSETRHPIEWVNALKGGIGTAIAGAAVRLPDSAAVAPLRPESAIWGLLWRRICPGLQNEHDRVKPAEPTGNGCEKYEPRNEPINYGLCAAAPQVGPIAYLLNSNLPFDEGIGTSVVPIRSGRCVMAVCSAKELHR
jgi:hypothetical protein